jgi:hypothetical protein
LLQKSASHVRSVSCSFPSSAGSDISDIIPPSIASSVPSAASVKYFHKSVDSHNHYSEETMPENPNAKQATADDPANICETGCVADTTIDTRGHIGVVLRKTIQSYTKEALAGDDATVARVELSSSNVEGTDAGCEAKTEIGKTTADNTQCNETERNTSCIEETENKYGVVCERSDAKGSGNPEISEDGHRGDAVTNSVLCNNDNAVGNAADVTQKEIVDICLHGFQCHTDTTVGDVIHIDEIAFKDPVVGVYSDSEKTVVDIDQLLEDIIDKCVTCKNCHTCDSGHMGERLVDDDVWETVDDEVSLKNTDARYHVENSSKKTTTDASHREETASDSNSTEGTKEKGNEHCRNDYYDKTVVGTGHLERVNVDDDVVLSYDVHIDKRIDDVHHIKEAGVEMEVNDEGDHTVETVASADDCAEFVSERIIQSDYGPVTCTEGRKEALTFDSFVSGTMSTVFSVRNLQDGTDACCEAKTDTRKTTADDTQFNEMEHDTGYNRVTEDKFSIVCESSDTKGSISYRSTMEQTTGNSDISEDDHRGEAVTNSVLCNNGNAIGNTADVTQKEIVDICLHGFQCHTDTTVADVNHIDEIAFKDPVVGVYSDSEKTVVDIDQLLEDIIDKCVTCKNCHTCDSGHMGERLVDDDVWETVDDEVSLKNTDARYHVENSSKKTTTDASHREETASDSNSTEGTKEKGNEHCRNDYYDKTVVGTGHLERVNVDDDVVLSYDVHIDKRIDDVHHIKEAGVEMEVNDEGDHTVETVASADDCAEFVSERIIQSDYGPVTCTEGRKEALTFDSFVSGTMSTVFSVRNLQDGTDACCEAKTDTRKTTADDTQFNEMEHDTGYNRVTEDKFSIVCESSDTKSSISYRSTMEQTTGNSDISEDDHRGEAVTNSVLCNNGNAIGNTADVTQKEIVDICLHGFQCRTDTGSETAKTIINAAGRAEVVLGNAVEFVARGTCEGLVDEIFVWKPVNNKFRLDTEDTRQFDEAGTRKWIINSSFTEKCASMDVTDTTSSKSWATVQHNGAVNDWTAVSRMKFHGASDHVAIRNQVTASQGAADGTADTATVSVDSTLSDFQVVNGTAATGIPHLQDTCNSSSTECSNAGGVPQSAVYFINDNESDDTEYYSADLSDYSTALQPQVL